jgi:tripartite-type tricarboxylate transporter receptor subunit TctC
MPGAAGLVMANYMFSSAPRDGTVIALGPGSIATAALFNIPGARYNAQQFTWLGSLNSDVGVAVSWRSSDVKQAADLFSHELIVGGAGATDQSVVYPNALNKLLGTRFKVISGYRGSGAIALALERGEVMGVGGWNYSSIVSAHPDWIREGKLNILLQFSPQPHPALPNVPTVVQLARTDRERAVLKLVFSPSEMGRAVFAPPDVPPRAAHVLRAALRAVLKDPAFLEDAKQSHLEINQPMGGKAVTALVSELYGADPHMAKLAANAIASSGQSTK